MVSSLLLIAIHSREPRFVATSAVGVAQLEELSSQSVRPLEQGMSESIDRVSVVRARGLAACGIDRNGFDGCCDTGFI
jgi:hypothetical protein